MAGPDAHRIHSEGGRARGIAYNATQRSKADQLAFHSAGGKDQSGSAAAAEGSRAHAEAKRAAAPVATLSTEEYAKRARAATKKLQRAWSKGGEHGPQPDIGDGRALVASGKY